MILVLSYGPSFNRDLIFMILVSIVTFLQKINNNEVPTNDEVVGETSGEDCEVTGLSLHLDLGTGGWDSSWLNNKIIIIDSHYNYILATYDMYIDIDMYISIYYIYIYIHVHVCINRINPPPQLPEVVLAGFLGGGEIKVVPWEVKARLGGGWDM